MDVHHMGGMERSFAYSAQDTPKHLSTCKWEKAKCMVESHGKCISHIQPNGFRLYVFQSALHDACTWHDWTDDTQLPLRCGSAVFKRLPYDCTCYGCRLSDALRSQKLEQVARTQLRTSSAVASVRSSGHTPSCHYTSTPKRYCAVHLSTILVWTTNLHHIRIYATPWLQQ